MILTGFLPLWIELKGGNYIPKCRKLSRHHREWGGDGMSKARRYLTPLAKTHELKSFHALRKQPIPEEDLGDRGYPDSDILPFCDWLNSFKGVCTLQSCAGHHPSEKNGASSGCLWVWFDKKMNRRFRKHVFELPRPPIESIRHIYLDYSGWRQGTGGEKEFVEFIFAGNDKGPEALDQSLSALRGFLEPLLSR